MASTVVSESATTQPITPLVPAVPRTTPKTDYEGTPSAPAIEKRATLPSDIYFPEPDSLITTDAANLLRIYLLNAKLDRECEAYAVISVGTSYAKTKLLSKANNPSFDEHFVIEYDKEIEDKLEVVVAIYDKEKDTDTLLGEWRVRLSDVARPQSGENKKVESWYTEEPKLVALHDISGKKEVGSLLLRARREEKVVGTLQIKIKDAKLPTDTEANLILKLAGDNKNSDVAQGKDGLFTWQQSEFTFEATMLNNVRDLFIECHQHNYFVGEVRVTLFDAKHKALQEPQPILTNDTKQKVGEMRLEAKIIKK